MKQLKPWTYTPEQVDNALKSIKQTLSAEEYAVFEAMAKSIKTIQHAVLEGRPPNRQQLAEIIIDAEKGLKKFSITKKEKNEELE